MNHSSTTTLGIPGPRSTPAVAFARSAAALFAGLAQRVWRKPLLLWSLLLAAALLAFFVHLLNAQVIRGEKLREEQRMQAQRPDLRLTLAEAVHHPVNALVVNRQPLTRP